MEEALKAAGAAADAKSFATARALARANGGAAALRAHLEAGGFVGEDGKLTTGVKPFNVFARVGSGVMKQPGMDAENESLGDFGKRFVVACNRPEADKDWKSEAPEHVGKVSMGARHRFITTSDLSWDYFNVLAFGLDGDAKSLREAIEALEAAMEAARTFARGTANWSASPDRLGMFFHCFPYNSVQSLHMHLVDLNETGPTFTHFAYKNLPAEAVLTVLRQELQQVEGRSQTAWLVGIAAVTVAVGALLISRAKK